MEIRARVVMDLADRPFVSSRSGATRLTRPALDHLLRELGGEWVVVDGHHLRRTYTFTDFAGALAFVNRVGALAEEINHHPNVQLSWGKATIEIWTHTVDGLSEGDFVFAARVDVLLTATR